MCEGRKEGTYPDALQMSIVTAKRVVISHACDKDDEDDGEDEEGVPA